MTALGSETESLAPLQGVRVIVVGQAIAGPMTGRFFADYGAEVIRIEWTGHLDRLRHATPSKRQIRDVNSSSRWLQYNAGVKSIGLSLKTAPGRTVFENLVSKADVLICNFAAGVLPSLGISPSKLLAANPKLIIALLTLFGQGEYAEQPGLGDGLSAYSGFYWLTGYPDASPLMPQGPYTDYVAPPMAAVSILAALEDVAATGQGRILDVSECEFATWFLMPEVLAAQLSSTAPIRQGAFGSGPAVSFATRASGDDRWCTVLIETDAQWAALSRVMGKPDLAGDARFATTASRFGNRQAMAAIVESWSCELSREDVIAECRKAGVLSVAVADAGDVQADRFLTERGHWRAVDHSDNGNELYNERFPFILSSFEPPAKLPPDFSEHSHEILSELLQYSDDEIAELAANGVVE